MTSSGTLDFSWVSEVMPAVCPEVHLSVEAQAADEVVPTFDFGPRIPNVHRLTLSASYDKGRTGWWNRSLARSIPLKAGEVCFVNLLTVPSESIETNVDGLPFKDGGALLAKLLKHAETGNKIVVLCHRRLVLGSSSIAERRASNLRGWLADHHSVDWVIYLGSEAGTSQGSASSHSELALLAIEAGSTSEASRHPTRIADLARLPRKDWPRILKYCAKRGGGERDDTIVLRDQTLDGEPWTYQRFSADMASTLEDAAEAGALCRLADFVEDIRKGPGRKSERREWNKTTFASGADETKIPDDSVSGFALHSGRLVRTAYVVNKNKLDETLHLREGDILIGSVVNLNDSGQVRTFTIATNDLPATFDNSCFLLRWRKDTPAAVAALLLQYLTTDHAKTWFMAFGVSRTLSKRALEQLEVPNPSPEILGALHKLTEVEQQYRMWADEVAHVRTGIFINRSVRDQVGQLIKRQQLEEERLQAATDAASFMHQVRNYFPYPIALRRAKIPYASSPRARIDEILDCAEQLVTLTSILCLIQDSHTTDENGPVMSTFASFCSRQSVHTDWGKCSVLVSQGARFAQRMENPLSLPFPDLALLFEEEDSDTNTWADSERCLRKWRNDLAHGFTPPDEDLEQIAGDLEQHLDRLLKAASFFASLPLVQVEDYDRCPITGKRTARYKLLTGISDAFERRATQVDTEVPRTGIGFLTRQGAFLSACPWLHMETCPTCKRPEIFVLNRYENEVATYIAMETGHGHEISSMKPAIEQVMAFGGESG
jgi:hypothetical protein